MQYKYFKPLFGLAWILFALIATPNATNAQTLAVTEHGDTIYVYDNGTWSFSLEESGNGMSELDALDVEINFKEIQDPFSFPENAKKEARSRLGFFKIRYDDSVWKRLPPSELNEEAEMAFQMRDRDVYCMIISEEIEIGDENLFKIAMDNMGSVVDSEMEVIHAERRLVNNSPIIRGTYEVNMSGMNLLFDSYYYSDSRGSVQFTTWTGGNVWKKYESEILDLLNGFISIKTNDE